MFDLSLDNRLSEWKKFRTQLEVSSTPLQDVQEFWKNAPFIPFNKNIDPYHQSSWPTPWEILECNKYDDFTKSLMIGWTLKLTNKFKDSNIELLTVVDKARTREYNLVYIDQDTVLNYLDTGPVDSNSIPDDLSVRNMVIINPPR